MSRSSRVYKSCRSIGEHSTIMFDGGNIGRLFLAVLLFLHFSDVYGDDPVIDLSPGLIHGTTLTSRNGRSISAFLGIPYAVPPVGPLRFASTEMLPLENNVDLQAKVDGNRCPQLDDDGAVVGDEDCLFLNVYAPQTSTSELLPTMVYFHGGGFVRGSGSSTDAGPEYLLDRDIVLVTINYRLGVLGFLSSGDDEAPGNFGLKDQAVALEWVRQYIQFFGGTAPVTIFGQGAGGASTSLHAISERSQGLFDQYISQSGNAMSFWALVNNNEAFRNYPQRARNLGDHLNCISNFTTVLVACLREADVQSLVDSNDIFDDAILRFDTWAPTNEWGGVEDPFLAEAPLLQTVVKQVIKDCPAIIGNVHDEGLLFSAELYANDTLYDTIVSDVDGFLWPIVNLTFDNPDRVTRALKDFYFDDTTPIDKELFIQNVTKFVSDMGFRHPTDFFLSITTNVMQSQVYVYTFDYRGTYSRTSATIGNNDDVGVTHGDDLTYLFPMKNADFELSGSDEKMIDIMVDFWTSFARTGTPTSQYLADPNVWEPYDHKTHKAYLHIGKNSDPTDVQLYEENDEILKMLNDFVWEELGEFFSGLAG